MLIQSLKNQLLLVGALFCFSSFSSRIPDLNQLYPKEAQQPIIFIENDYSKAIKKAKAEGKYLFVDAYASWCGPCKQLKQTTFNDGLTADFFNKTFVNLSIDMEKGQGLSLSSKWGVEEYPTLLIMDVNGKILHRSIGYVDAKELIAFGKQVLPEK